MLFRKSNRNRVSKEEVLHSEESEDTSLKLTSENIKNVLGKSKDILFREILVNKDIPTTLIYADGLVDDKLISDYILKPLVQEPEFKLAKDEKEVICLIQQGTVYLSHQKIQDKINDAIFDILSGNAALIFDREMSAVTFRVKGFEKRSMTEPSGENVIKGSKDSFVETLRVNTATIRRRIKTQNLIIDETKVGKQTQTAIAIVYIEDLTNRHFVKEIKNRLSEIKIDGVLQTGFIEEYIIDHKYSPFPQIDGTERPDKFCSSILEGRVGLIIDGIPVAFIIPATLIQFLKAPEEYSQNFIVSSVIRFLRYMLTLVTLFLPGFYVSITTFHQEMIPTDLALSIKAAKEGVPFPSFIEVIFMLIAFEILIEAGLRLPKTIGQAISIVGAVVVGDAAVSARLVSPTVVVTIAITAISSFTMPNQDFSNALRLWRFIMVILSSIIGLFGLSLGAIMLLHHLSKIEILGVPYLSPFVAADAKQLQDTLFRLPLSTQKKRPVNLRTTNKRRQK